jgi:hypothetical protein
MIYECRLNRFRRHHIYAVLTTIVGLYLLSYIGFGSAAHWWASSIGIAIAAGAWYLIGNTKVRIEIDGGAVVVEHSGMVQANFTIEELASVAVDGSGRESRIVVATNEGFNYLIPCGCFSKAEIDALLLALRGA